MWTAWLYPGRHQWLMSLLLIPNFFLKGNPDTDQKFIDVRMRAVKRKIIVLSGKGGNLFQVLGETYTQYLSFNSICTFWTSLCIYVGVGKSTIAACLSMALASLQTKVRSTVLPVLFYGSHFILSYLAVIHINRQRGASPCVFSCMNQCCCLCFVNDA